MECSRCQQDNPPQAKFGMRPLVAHCHAGLAKVYRRTGKPDQAREHLATATTMYGEMSMTYWLEKLERELNARSGADPEH